MVAAPTGLQQAISEANDARVFSHRAVERLFADEREIAALRVAVVNASIDAGRRKVSNRRRAILAAAAGVAERIDPSGAAAQARVLTELAYAADALCELLAIVDQEGGPSKLEESAVSMQSVNKFSENFGRVRAMVRKTADRNNEVIESLRLALATFGPL